MAKHVVAHHRVPELCLLPASMGIVLILQFVILI